MRNALVLCALALAVAGCAGPRAKMSVQAATIYVSRFDISQIARQAAAVRERRATTPSVWLVAGPVFGPGGRLADAERATAVLNAAGVDAVQLDPAWLELGSASLARLLASARFYVLGANVLDGDSRSLGHEMMVKRLGSARIAVTGIWLDSVPGWQFRSPEYAARLIGPVLRQRADVVGSLVGPNRDVSGWGLDFVAGASASGAVSVPPPVEPDRLRRVDVRITGGVAGRMVVAEQQVGAIAPDSVVQQLIDSLWRPRVEGREVGQ